MPLEIERKYLGVDFDRLRRALSRAGAVERGAHFEANVVFDTPDHRLHAARRLLRVRSQERPEGSRHVLTLKLPVAAPAPGAFKTREERELTIESAAAMCAVLTGLGFMPVARYEKVREVWRLATRGPKPAQLLVELDELPFASVVEVEGPADGQDDAARLLGLDNCEISTKSYHALHQEWRAARGLSEELSFVFGPEERRRLRKRLGLPDETGTRF